MVKTKQGFVLAASFLSGIAATLSIISLSTEQWVVSDGEFEALNEQFSTVKYGLFSGTFMQNLGGKQYYQIKATCLTSKNVCAYICGATSQSRIRELESLYRGEDTQFDGSCPKIRRIHDAAPYKLNNVPITRDDRTFLNCGLYISTLVFLCLSATFGVLSATLSIWNTAANPIEVYFSIYGIYIYNATACVCSIFTLILWGALFGSIIVYNVGILYTIKGDMRTDGYASLGFSYWINLVSAVLYASSIAVLYMRQHLINQEPEIKIHTTSQDKDVGDIMIY